MNIDWVGKAVEKASRLSAARRDLESGPRGAARQEDSWTSVLSCTPRSLQLVRLAVSAVLEEGEHGQHPAVDVGGLRQAELHHDAAHVLFHGALGHP